jgi:hypothetical protein
VETDVMEFKSCNTERCDDVSDAVWGEWSDWAADGEDAAGLPLTCSAQCGGGNHYRTREVLTGEKGGGARATGAKTEYKECNTQPCGGDPQDCVFSDWSYYGECSQSVNGVQERTRSIEQYAENGGALCSGSLTEVKACNTPSDFPLHDGHAGVLSAWSAWSACTVTCDGGSKTRTRTVEEAGASVAGKALSEVAACSTEPCCPECSENVDCVWAEWDDWSSCPVTCGGGETTRYRDVLTMAKANGAPCASQDSFEVAVCSPALCHKKEYCVWSDWGPFGACSATCGGGRAGRERHLVLSEAPPAVGASLDETELSEQYKELSGRVTQANLAFGGVAGVAAIGTVVSGLWVFKSLREQ